MSDFVVMVNHPNYEMMLEHPHTIRKISNQNIVAEFAHPNGYIQVNLQDENKPRKFYKHRLIAEQFISNPDNLPQVDHIDHNRANNRISNLRWCSNSINQYNRSFSKSVQYEFIDDIPEDAIIVDFYYTRTEQREFDEGRYYYWYDEENNEDIFYSKIDDNIYKILHKNTNKSGNQFVALRDINNKQVCVSINKFRRQHDLL